MAALLTHAVRSLLVLLPSSICTVTAAQSQSHGDPFSAAALKKLSVEELMSLEVTSVSRASENLGSAAAAVTVITSEDIRRSGATTLPEALRFVPGLNVARRNSNTWAVSSRGFSSVSSEKLLVLSDTRSIYTPLFSGVLWDVQDAIMADIERIEVIRGPGASLWGSNAVNGVINVTTRSAHDTLGWYAEAGAGTEELAAATVRYGASAGRDLSYRVYGKYFERDASFNTDPVRSDDWRMAHAGFRSDWDASTQDRVTFQGDAYRGNIGQLGPAINIIGRPGPTGNLEVGVSGGNVLGRWRRTLGSGSNLQLRAYYDRTHRDDPAFTDDLDTADLDFQHDFALTARQQLIWGLNWRFTSNRNEGKGIFAVQPPSSDDQTIGAFVQDQIAVGEALRFTLGTKLEHNDFSGYEVQPSVRVAWDPRPGHTLWSAVSRAVRVPTRLERDIAIDVTDPTANPVARLLGNADFGAEELLAYELGYRWQALGPLFVDLAAFYNRYEDLASLELGAPFLDPLTGVAVFPIENQNLTDGHTSGLEAQVTYAPIDRWRLSAIYSYIDVTLEPRGADLNRGSFLEGATPRHQFGLRSFLDLPGGLEVDAQFRTLSAVRSLPEVVSGEGIPGYSELDLRLGWRAGEQWRISVVGQNLLHRRHTEFGTPQTRGQIERSVYARIDWGS